MSELTRDLGVTLKAKSWLGLVIVTSKLLLNLSMMWPS